MKKTLLYIFAAALASMALFGLQSCGLEEPYFGPQEDPSAGVVEFIARPASYHSHDVTTKADGNPSTFEDDEIHNAFLLVFDAYGQRLLCEEINLNTEDGGLVTAYNQLSVKIDRALGDVTACILANVPVNFARGITGTKTPNNNPNLTDGSANAYLNTAVLDFTYSTSTNVMAAPVVDLDSNTSTASVPCIPMFSPLTSINLSSAPAAVQVELQRLFAKVSVDLSLAVDLEDEGWNQVINGATYFDLNDFYLYNMPTKVRLMEDATSESAWIKTKTAFSSSIKGDKDKLQIDRVYNNNANSRIVFDFYVPEYYLNSKANPSTDEKLKPNNIQTGTYPIYLFLDATYSQFSLNSTDLQYKIYLGRDAHSDFSLARNVNYINYLRITGIDNHDGEGAVEIDHRVTTSVINNPVAKEGKSANCYIAARTGEYHFPAYKGAYNDLTLAALCEGDENSEVVVLASDNSNIQFSGLKYDPDQNMIMFNIDRIADGNVVIALKNGDDSIEWSWHLWCNTQSWWEGMLNTDWGELKTQTYPNGSIMADRNLGASSTTAAGLYYTYGSKKPFITDGYYGGGTNGAETWDTEGKAVNDPCPPGYRVPDVGAWDTGAGKNNTSQLAFIYSQTPSVILYYTGHIVYDASNDNYNTITSIEESKDYTLDNYSLEPIDIIGSLIPEYINETGGIFSKNKTRTRVDKKVNYFDFVYNTTTITSFGDFWYSSGEVFHYEAYDVDWTQIFQDAFSIKSCRTEEYNVYQDQKSTNYGVSWSNVGDPYQSEPTYGTKTSGFGADIILQVLNEARKREVSGSNSWINPQSNYGYQIRCIQDVE